MCCFLVRSWWVWPKSVGDGFWGVSFTVWGCRWCGWVCCWISFIVFPLGWLTFNFTPVVFQAIRSLVSFLPFAPLASWLSIRAIVFCPSAYSNAPISYLALLFISAPRVALFSFLTHYSAQEQLSTFSSSLPFPSLISFFTTKTICSYRWTVFAHGSTLTINSILLPGFHSTPCLKQLESGSSLTLSVACLSSTNISTNFSNSSPVSPSPMTISRCSWTLLSFL